MRTTIDARLQLAAIELAEELHFGRAAQKLHIAVSTLSKQIALLEEKLGVTLFLRSSKGVELTDAGRAYVEEARASLLHAEKAINVARATNDGREHILSAGHTPYTDLTLVTMLLSIHLPLYPNTKVQLHSDFAFDLVHGLLAADLDVALIAWPPEGAALTLVEVGSASLYAVLPDGHAAYGKEQISLTDIAYDPWVLFNKRVHPLIYDAILSRARALGISPREVHHIVTAQEAVHLVQEHAGIAFLAKAVALSSQKPGVIVRPIADEQLRLKTYLALRSNEPSRMINEFARAFLRKCAPLVEKSDQLTLPIS